MTVPIAPAEASWRIVARNIMAAPRRTKLSLLGFAASTTLAVLLQFGTDFSGFSDPLEVAELLSVVLGSLGTCILGLAYLLHQSNEGLACGRKLAVSFVPKQVNLLLLALPTLGVIGGSMLAGAIGILLVRALMARPILFVVALMYAGFLVMMGVMITRTTRFLYGYAREQALAAAQARNQAAEAELAALQAQMNPHFLFNTLNTVAALVKLDPAAAERTVEHLSSILRRTLDRSHRTFASVEDELDYVRSYLGVEQQRLGQRLVVTWAVEDRTRGMRVPTMTLQPLVENALKHAVGMRLQGGSVRVAAEAVNGTLRLAVEDDGPGFPRRHREGTGLGNLRRRLQTIYGERAALDIDRSGSGGRVVVEIPAEKN